MKKRLADLLLIATVGAMYGAIFMVGSYMEDQRWEEAYQKSLEVQTPARHTEVQEVETEVVEVDYFEYELTDDCPKEIQLACIEYGREYNISPELLQALAFKESSYNPKAVNGNCVGLCQINPNCHRERLQRLDLTETDLYTVEGSIQVAADYLQELFIKYEDCGDVLHHFNGNSSMYGKAELSEYAQGILNMAMELEADHGKGVINE